MVKNSTGGNKSKGLARKNFGKRESALRVVKEEGEIYAQAVKVMGGSIASAIDIEGNPLRAHIRGKFRGRGKRDNFIGPNTWLLVGLHNWQSDKIQPGDIRDCDILEVYNDMDKTRLKNSVTSVDWTKFITNDTKSIGSSECNDNIGVIFADDTTQEYEQLIAAQANEQGEKNIIMDDGEVIDVDDI
jgi:hypothetical protein